MLFSYAVNLFPEEAAVLIAIKKKTTIAAVLTCLGILVIISYLLFRGEISKHLTQEFLLIIIVASIVSGVFYLKAHKKLIDSRLITGNPIYQFQIAEIQANQWSEIEKVEATISYLGILIGEKLIKFNQDGIQVKDIEIGEDSITFFYGPKEWTQNIRLLRPDTDSVALLELTERIRGETGITPRLLLKEWD